MSDGEAPVLELLELYIYIEREGGREMVNFGESDEMIKRSGKVDKSNTCNGFSSNISFLIQESEEVLPWIKNKILLLNPLCLIYSLFYLFVSYIYIYIYITL